MQSTGCSPLAAEHWCFMFMALAPCHQPKCLFAVGAGLMISSFTFWCVGSVLVQCPPAAFTAAGTRVCLGLLQKVQNPTCRGNSAGFEVSLLTEGITLQSRSRSQGWDAPSVPERLFDERDSCLCLDSGLQNWLLLVNEFSCMNHKLWEWEALCANSDVINTAG